MKLPRCTGIAQAMTGVFSTARRADEVGSLWPHVQPGGEMAAVLQSASTAVCVGRAGDAALWHPSLWRACIGHADRQRPVSPRSGPDNGAPARLTATATARHWINPRTPRPIRGRLRRRRPGVNAANRRTRRCIVVTVTVSPRAGMYRRTRRRPACCRRHTVPSAPPCHSHRPLLDTARRFAHTPLPRGSQRAVQSMPGGHPRSGRRAR